MGHAKFDHAKFPLHDLDLVQEGLIGPADQAAGSVFATSVQDPHLLDATGYMHQLFAWPFYSCLLDAQPNMSSAVGQPLPSCSGALSFRKRRSSGHVNAESTRYSGSSHGV